MSYLKSRVGITVIENWFPSRRDFPGYFTWYLITGRLSYPSWNLARRAFRNFATITNAVRKNDWYHHARGRAYGKIKIGCLEKSNYPAIRMDKFLWFIHDSRDLSNRYFAYFMKINFLMKISQKCLRNKKIFINCLTGYDMIKRMKKKFFI